MGGDKAMRELSATEIERVGGAGVGYSGPFNGPVITLYHGVNFNVTYNTITGEISGMQMFGPAPQVLYL